MLPNKKLLVLFIMASALSVFCTNSGFANTTLAETVKQVLVFNPSLKSVQEHRQSLLADTDREKAEWYPKVNATSQYRLQQGDNPNNRDHNISKYEYTSGFSVGLGVSQKVWDGLNTYNRVAAAQYRNTAIDFRVVDVASLLAMEGVVAHVEIIRHTATLKLANDYVRTHKKILQQVVEVSTSGMGTAADTDQAKGRLQRANAIYATAVTNLAIGKAAYEKITGKRPQDLATAMPIPLPTIPMEAVVHDALKKNPRIAAYMSEVKALESDKESLKGNFSPQMDVEVGPNYVNPNYAINQNDQWDFGGRINMRWNIFNGGADVAAVQSMSAKGRQLRQDMFSYADILKNDLDNAFSNYNNSLELQSIYKKTIGFNIITRDAYLEQFKLGMRTLLDVLDAESELFNSQTQLVLAQANTVMQSYKIATLQGAILDIFAIPTKNMMVMPVGAR